jgi:16S rRNA (cytosine1402-N4)-methyltransferase
MGLAADVVLADLGFSSNQVESAERGFSFSRDGPLDMRLDPGAPVTAAELVNTLPERELAELIRDFGEERWAGKIAEKIVQERKREPITTTAQLAAVARLAIGHRDRSSGIDSATRTFQALRIAVNDEIGRLESLLESIDRAGAQVQAGAATWLSPGARVGIIAFHSLEDRPVKQGFGSMAEKGRVTLLNKKPIRASDEEVAKNPRSRSAKFRAVRLTTGERLEPV